MNKWDERFLRLAEHVAGWSKDPSTKVGAVITQGNRVISVGFNGFAPGVNDTGERLNDRTTKLAITLHAEENALHFAHEAARGGTLYVWPMQPCAMCAGRIARSGIKRVVAPEPTPAHVERWGESFALATEILQEAWVSLDLVVLPSEPVSDPDLPAVIDDVVCSWCKRWGLDEKSAYSEIARAEMMGDAK